MPAWYTAERKVILASKSPRRRDILSLMGMTFEVVEPTVLNEDDHLSALDIEGSLCRLARAKAESVSSRFPDALVLGCDTIVTVGDRILGKPANRRHAREMLQALSGRSHVVYSGVALVCAARGFAAARSAATEVVFRELPEAEIERYLDIAEYLDKAGAYGIQQEALVFVERIAGCYYNVVGLPVAATIGLFEMFTSRKALDHVGEHRAH